MEYILISKVKLKIICEQTDLSTYGINAESLDYGDPESRLFLEEILEHAKQELGFDTKNHRVLVQLYPSADGGCEIFINKLGVIENIAISGEKKSKKEEKPKKQAIEKIFLFNKLDFLLDACRLLSLTGFKGKSEAFYLTEKGYFLAIELECDSYAKEYNLPDIDEYSFISEYGEEQDQKAISAYLREYAKPIIKKDAANILGKI